MSDEQEKPIEFPQYLPPGMQIADRKQQGPLVKMMTKMIPKKLKTRLIGRPKGIQSDQNVHIKSKTKKVRFY